MAAGVSVKIGANNDEFESTVNRTKRSLGGLSDEMKKNISTSAKLGAAAVAAGAAIAAGFVVKGLAAVDAQAKLARQMGATIDGMRAVQIAGSDAGVGLQTMNDAAKKLNQRIGEALRGSGEAAEAFKMLGVEAAFFGQLDVDQRMALVADRIKELNLSIPQTADLMKRLGIEQSEVVNLMLSGGDAIRNARNELVELGLSLSAIDAAKVEIANDSFARTGLIVDAITQRMAVEFAPVLAAVSKMMVQASKDGLNMGGSVRSAFDVGIDAAAFFANAIDVIVRAIKYVGFSFEVVGREIHVSTLLMADAIINGPVGAANLLIDTLNKIPGVDIEPVGLSGLGEKIKNELRIANIALGLVHQDVQKIFDEPLSGTAFKDAVNEARKNAEEAAKAASETVISGPGFDMPDTKGDKQKEADAFKKELENRVQAIREANMTERELLLLKFEQENEDLRVALENEIFTRDEYNALLAEQEARKEQILTDIDKKAADERKRLAEDEARVKEQAYGKFYSNLASLMGTNSKKLFQIGKAAALANAAVDGYAAITGAYKVGARIGGPPVGAAFAAAAGAATFAQIQNIRNQQFGGGGGGGAASSGGVSSTTQTQQQAQSQPAGGTLTVQGLSAGSLLTGDVVAGLANELLEYQRRGGTVVLAT